jgi:hypothetical protein
MVTRKIIWIPVLVAVLTFLTLAVIGVTNYSFAGSGGCNHVPLMSNGQPAHSCAPVSQP